ncbi:hypothetical protein EDB81DRAFT_669576 [Dactylonectria macrodidyma]|uniref:Uncharacterized protein n=1 Tax=Dactylonectria macrodidyma TaxID=307937 RepID=A0A9P9D6R1_9HYPO|nr:hypothetical protein EDB81DRAFT_669576 [Dactylonectria macrodidyma]
MQTEQQAFVIVGLAGVGKSTLARRAKHSASRPVVELRKDLFRICDDGTRHSDPLPAYMDAVMAWLGKPCVLLLDHHFDIRDALVDRGVDFYFVYPKEECRDEYCSGFVDKNVADVYRQYWSEFLRCCER